MSSMPLIRPPLHTSGSRIVDTYGTPVTLRSINWYGASDMLFVPSGLDKQHRNDIAILIRALGFNSVRLPYSDELVVSNPVIQPSLLAANPDLVGATALDVFFAVVSALTEVGLAVIPNDHITHATWCCGIDPCDAMWSNDHLGSLCRISQTEEDWLRNWETVMTPLAGNPLVIGADLRNEVRGLWGTMWWSKWARAAEMAGERILSINPDWLIFVEGVSSANDLSGVTSRPIVLSIPRKVVYSAHVYSWSGWGALDPYSRRTYSSFAKDMSRNWAYLLDRNIAPVWVGEFGTVEQPRKGDLNYWNHLIEFLAKLEEEGQGASWGYWAINPRKPKNNEWEGYGLVADDWQKVRYDYRLKGLEELGLPLKKR
ncbi:glycoside hydrolase family 5 protein [Aulographum hederae CBS 113979]|uniref:Glycoside hydrolase family 5 protein n=1 Tax=Aulographum hederae CBS 113979 TaxID=1176131 RepID=A0A6G1GR06_9PEZI|nr:glycoside hydrolase family 5 protein [Aulographum hederae CBS 113979]